MGRNFWGPWYLFILISGQKSLSSSLVHVHVYTFTFLKNHLIGWSVSKVLLQHTWWVLIQILPEYLHWEHCHLRVRFYIIYVYVLLLLFSCSVSPILCDPTDGSPQAPLSAGFSGKNPGMGFHFLLHVFTIHVFTVYIYVYAKYT